MFWTFLSFATFASFLAAQFAVSQILRRRKLRQLAKVEASTIALRAEARRQLQEKQRLLEKYPHRAFDCETEIVIVALASKMLAAIEAEDLSKVFYYWNRINAATVQLRARAATRR